MADNQTPEVRRKIMQSVRGKDTLPERTIRSYLHRQGFRFRKNVKNLPGTPDIVLPKYNTIVFVHGCFWHGHEGCRYAGLPVQNHQFWVNKIESNTKRDQRQRDALIKAGWRVITIWGCELKPKIQEATLQKLINELQGTVDSSTEVQ